MNKSIQRDCIGMFKKIIRKNVTVHPITKGSHPPFMSHSSTTRAPVNMLQQAGVECLPQQNEEF
uniref:Ovule protein n=1 Tax=Meloidogyne hapla TaxID=6305 RepID=A0A1I8BG28_MELHA